MLTCFRVPWPQHQCQPPPHLVSCPWTLSARSTQGPSNRHTTSPLPPHQMLPSFPSMPRQLEQLLLHHWVRLDLGRRLSWWLDDHDRTSDRLFVLFAYLFTYQSFHPKRTEFGGKYRLGRWSLLRSNMLDLQIALSNPIVIRPILGLSTLLRKDAGMPTSHVAHYWNSCTDNQRNLVWKCV